MFCGSCLNAAVILNPFFDMSKRVYYMYTYKSQNTHVILLYYIKNYFKFSSDPVAILLLEVVFALVVDGGRSKDDFGIVFIFLATVSINNFGFTGLYNTSENPADISIWRSSDPVQKLAVKPTIIAR